MMLGWDCFNTPVGQRQSMTCRVCEQTMQVGRNINGPRTSIESLAGQKFPHDEFRCADSGQTWHQQALALRLLMENTPSKTIEDILKTEAKPIQQQKSCTWTTP